MQKNFLSLIWNISDLITSQGLPGILWGNHFVFGLHVYINIYANPVHYLSSYVLYSQWPCGSCGLALVLAAVVFLILLFSYPSWLPYLSWPGYL